MIFQRNFFKKAKSYYVVDLENALYADCDFIDSGSNYAVCVYIYISPHSGRAAEWNAAEQNLKNPGAPIMFQGALVTQGLLMPGSQHNRCP